ncbi:heavy-metal-associated domain-containing protein [Pararhodobacter aggregans]|uniref:heavy-metal-associated domain-containing protein n=1 Tax=Pararhodobacter aggregans TaxID=404875 RepID=UPI003A8EE9A2
MTRHFTLSVPDMSCGHCRASIDSAVTPLGAKTDFDMSQRRVTVTGEATPEAVIAALDRIGFPAEPV